MKHDKRLITLLIPFVFCVTMICMANNASAAGFDTKVLRGAAVGLLVNETGPELNKFINTVTLQKKIPVGQDTKVVPILSVGEKGYVGAAQVAGPASYVKTVKAIWQYEDNFSNNEFRLKILVPSASLNPLEFKKVQKVGISAVIDVSLDGRWYGQTKSSSIKTGDIIKAGVVAVAINAAASPLNKAINSVTNGLAANTKVVPLLSIGDKAYIGGVQVSGATSLVTQVKTAYQYEELFDNGKFRVKIIVPSNSNNPLKFTRVKGVGITALIDTSIADQERIRNRRDEWIRYRPQPKPIDGILKQQFKIDTRSGDRHDQGLHKGWYIGKGNQRKLISGIWVTRYNSLSSKDKEAFVVWWNKHYKDDPKKLEKEWVEWKKERGIQQNRSVPADDRRGKARGHGNNHK